MPLLERPSNFLYLHSEGFKAQLGPAGYPTNHSGNAGFSEEELKRAEVTGCVFHHDEIIKDIRETWFSGAQPATSKDNQET